MYSPEEIQSEIGQLVEQPILMGGAVESGAIEVVAFHLLEFDTPSGMEAKSRRMHNQLTKKSAIRLLNFLHHLGTGTYFDTDLYNLRTRRYEPDTSGTRLNPAIFDALRHVRGGRRGLELYALRRRATGRSGSVFGEQEADGVRLRFR